MNKVILIGNLTRDPELSQISSGVSVCKMGIAVNRKFANANGEREVDFFNITAWRALGENCAKFLTKGGKICVVGSIQIRSYDDKEGVKKTSVDIVADDVEFLSGKSDDGGVGVKSEPRAAQSKKQVSELTPVESEDLPF